MDIEFRRNSFRDRGNNLWHWCPECPGWPRSEYETAELTAEPPAAELCPECRGLDVRNRCSRQE